MARNTGYLQYIIEEVLGEIDGVTSKGMFGGYGIYKHGVIFAMIIQDQLYFKTDEHTRTEYENRGSSPFSYTKKDKQVMLTSYYTVPPEIMENREEIIQWVEKAYEVGKSHKK